MTYRDVIDLAWQRHRLPDDATVEQIAVVVSGLGMKVAA
jgi:hypothetical protein